MSIQVEQEGPSLEERRQSRRLKAFHFAPEMLMHIGMGGAVRGIREKLPADAAPIHVFFNNPRQCFTVTVQSDEFDEVKIGEMIPNGDHFWVEQIEEVQS